MNYEAPAPSASLTDREGITLGEDLRLLAEEAREFAKAEVTFQKSRAAFAGSQIGRIVGLLVAALVVLFFAVMALVVGLVIALGPLLTPWGAMAAVAMALLILAIICALAAKRALTTLKRVMSAPLRGEPSE
ncbi:phage holin family protein [Novosphingobium profundi]|uniref:phage holin family protein n=1 Tax=Novosphingobium profundi TaxID=1774954 RepID=UPI001BDB12F4|nr:phage holin family protein [Novosphingobium profundi]MBT0669043.1 phage holin family protein [Novosphingobium profundi]